MKNTNKTKIIFLDVDGVINCQYTTQRHGSYIGIDPYMALLVDRIVQATGAKIVLSSTWRLSEKDREIVKKFVDFIDITPDISDYQRWDEVKAWLKDHPEVNRYAIIDDNWYNFPEDAEFVFKTQYIEGLTQGIADAVISYLNKEI